MDSWVFLLIPIVHLVAVFGFLSLLLAVPSIVFVPLATLSVTIPVVPTLWFDLIDILHEDLRFRNARRPETGPDDYLSSSPRMLWKGLAGTIPEDWVSHTQILVLRK